MNHCFSVKSLDTSIKLTEPEKEGQLTLGKCQLQIIGRAKRAPHWGVQSRFRVIYMYVCMYVFDCLWENNTKESYDKMRGQNYVVQTRACSKSSFGILKRSAD